MRQRSKEQGLNKKKEDMQENKTRVGVKKHTPDGGIHRPKMDGDIGSDLIVSKDTIIPASPCATATLIPSGVSIRIPSGYWCQIVGRSSAANKRGLMVVGATIDTGYLGELMACVFNMTGKEMLVKKGEKIAQAIFYKTHVFDFEEVDKLEATQRGESGYGSTGR